MNIAIDILLSRHVTSLHEQKLCMTKEMACKKILGYSIKAQINLGRYLNKNSKIA
jgi:hypothetical protein